MCYGVYLRKQRNSQRITSELVSHFGKDFLYLLVLSIKIDPAGYNDIINHVQKSSKLEKKKFSAPQRGGVRKYRSAFPGVCS